MFAVVTSDCMGCGACAATCPQVFRMNSYEIAEAYINPIPHDAEELTKAAAKSCPVAAIIIE